MTRRVYECDDLSVSYDSDVCIHAAECVRGLPAVFTPDGRPWIHLEHATADQVAAVIRRCPSGALHYQRKDGLPDEQPDALATVQAQPNGPALPARRPKRD